MKNQNPPPDAQKDVRLSLYYANQCDPKKCSGKKLVKFGLVRQYENIGETPKGAILMDPTSEKALSRADSLKKGLLFWIVPGNTRKKCFRCLKNSICKGGLCPIYWLPIPLISAGRFD